MHWDISTNRHAKWYWTAMQFPALTWSTANTASFTLVRCETVLLFSQFSANENDKKALLLWRMQVEIPSTPTDNQMWWILFFSLSIFKGFLTTGWYQRVDKGFLSAHKQLNPHRITRNYVCLKRVFAVCFVLFVLSFICLFVLGGGRNLGLSAELVLSVVHKSKTDW